MNKALLSSKKMDYCTPQDLFDALDAEFHFALDAAATDKSAKCIQYYTPETDGLSQSWNCGGQCSAIRHMDRKSGNGYGKHMKKHRREQRLYCLFQRGQTLRISTTTYTARRKSGLSGGDCDLRTKTDGATMRHRSHQWLLCIEEG